MLILGSNAGHLSMTRLEGLESLVVPVGWSGMNQASPYSSSRSAALALSNA